MGLLEGIIAFLNLLGFKYNKTDITSSEDVNISISGDDNKVTVDKSKHVHINLDIRDALEKYPDETKRFIRSLIQEDDLDKIIESTTDGEVKELRSYEARAGHLDLVANLVDNIPPTDVYILRASLYIRALYLEGKSEGIGKLKEDIGQRWGQRGRNIANLCSAGYFENLIIPVLKGEMKLPYPHESFHEFYNSVVHETAYSVFVPSMMTDKDLEDKIISQGNRNENEYNRSYVNIHAIGKDNVKRVYKVIEKLKRSDTFFSFSELINTDPNEEIIYAKLIFTKVLPTS